MKQFLVRKYWRKSCRWAVVCIYCKSRMFIFEILVHWTLIGFLTLDIFVLDIFKLLKVTQRLNVDSFILVCIMFSTTGGLYENYLILLHTKYSGYTVSTKGYTCATANHQTGSPASPWISSLSTGLWLLVAKLMCGDLWPLLKTHDLNIHPSSDQKLVCYHSLMCLQFSRSVIVLHSQTVSSSDVRLSEYERLGQSVRVSRGTYVYVSATSACADNIQTRQPYTITLLPQQQLHLHRDQWTTSQFMSFEHLVECN